MEENNQNEEFIWEEEEKGFGEDYTQEERAEMEEIYANTLTEITEKEVVKGTIVGINDRDVILNIGFKSDGLISATEFRDMPDLKIGDEVEVFIEKQEDQNGQLLLSRRKAKIVKAWEHIQGAQDNDEIIDGFVKRRTKGGLIVDIFGIEAFLPGSQIDVKPIRDFDVFVGKKMEVKVVKINYTNDNVVVSHKVLIEKDLEKQKAEILENLEKGQVLEGVIKNMTNFGVFIDLGGVDGLLHITDISWGRINHPEEMLSLDEKVNVVVLDFDDDKKRISLGMKQLTAHPWDSLPEDIEVGSKVKGKIVNVADYGAFLEILPGVEGLIHVSEMSWSQHLRNPQDFIEIGDELESVVLTLDREERKMSLGIKQLSEDPWTKQDVLTKYAVGTKHKGVVRNLTNFGLFIELEEGIDGLVHVSDLSWTKKIKHPSEFVKVGDELEVQVLELDVENRRLALGHKQLEENPWDTFETVFTRGSVHKCTVISKNDKGAVLELPYGIEGFATAKNLNKEDGSSTAVGETLDFKVLEFSKDDKRIVLSHTATYQEREERPARRHKPRKSGVAKINAGAEKDTLGDFEALTELRQKMAGGGKKAEAKPAAEKVEKAEEKKAEKPVAKKEEAKAEEAKVEEVKAEEAIVEEAKVEATAEEAMAETQAASPAEEKTEEVKEAPKAEAKAEDKKEEEKVEETADEEKVEEKAEVKADEKVEEKVEKKPAAKKAEAKVEVAEETPAEEAEKTEEVKKPAKKTTTKKAAAKKEEPKAEAEEEVKEEKAAPKKKAAAKPKAEAKKAAPKKEEKEDEKKAE
jgi:small subunit ribosomal protein S1